MLEYILLVAVNEPCCREEHYVGTFESCYHANIWINLKYSDLDYLETRCVLPEYVKLPKGFKHKYIKMTETSRWY